LRNAATEARAAITQTRVIEPITATTLHEAVTKLTELAKPNAGNKSGQQYVPDLIAEQTSEMEPRGAFRAASADESEVDCLRRELAKAKAQLEALGGIRISPERGAGAARAAPALPRGFRFAAARREERHEADPNKERKQ
jgi:hypothetical protein